MDAGSVSELAIAGTDDTGLWVSVPDRLDAAGTDIEHWHCSARVLGLGGFAGTTGVAQLWVDALRESSTRWKCSLLATSLGRISTSKWHRRP